MAKDPAFLFYFQDFLTGTQFMSLEAVGAYIRALCHQADKGSIPKKHMLIICQSSDDVMLEVCTKFSLDEHGNYINIRLKEEVEKRRNYAESRRKNRLGSKKSKKKHMKNISKTYDIHMENENVNENVNKDIPNIGEVKKFFTDNGYTETFAEQAYGYYLDNGWRDKNGNKVLNWKNKMRNNWFSTGQKVEYHPGTTITKDKFTF